MAPPKIFLILIAFFIIFCLPSRTEPIGHPSPLLKQTDTVSKISPYSKGLSSFLTKAFHILAPSRCSPK